MKKIVNEFFEIIFGKFPEASVVENKINCGKIQKLICERIFKIIFFLNPKLFSVVILSNSEKNSLIICKGTTGRMKKRFRVKILQATEGGVFYEIFGGILGSSGRKSKEFVGKFLRDEFIIKPLDVFP